MTTTDNDCIGRKLLNDNVEICAGSGLTDNEAIDRVFPLYSKQKTDEIKRLIGSWNLSAEGDLAYPELMNVMSGVRTRGRDVTFEHRWKRRKFTRQEVLETEELTNYAAAAARACGPDLYRQGRNV